MSPVCIHALTCFLAFTTFPTIFASSTGKVNIFDVKLSRIRKTSFYRRLFFQLADSLLNVFDPTLEEIRNEDTSNDKLIPVYCKPKMQAAILPGILLDFQSWYSWYDNSSKASFFNELC